MKVLQNLLQSSVQILLLIYSCAVISLIAVTLPECDFFRIKAIDLKTLLKWVF